MLHSIPLNTDYNIVYTNNVPSSSNSFGKINKLKKEIFSWLPHQCSFENAVQEISPTAFCRNRVKIYL